MDRGLCDRLRDNIARLSAVTTQSAEEREILKQISREFEEVALQLSWLHRGQRTLDERLEKIEQSLLSRIVRWPGVQYTHIRNLIGRWSQKSDSQYEKWLAYEKRSLFPHRDDCLMRIGTFHKTPPVTVALAVQEPRLDWLREALQSVLGQIYPAWELCICVDGTIDPSVSAYLDELSKSGSPVRVVSHASPRGISAALNSACSEASGEYIGFLRQDDVLSPYALFFVAEALQKHSPALLYSDEDALSADGRRVDPIFKPAWSPDLLYPKTYLSSFLVTSRQAFLEAGGFRGAYDGSEDFDLCLRITETDERVVHIPRILYHRRTPAARVTSLTSEAAPETKSPEARAIADALRRRKWNAEVTGGLSSQTFRITWAANRLVSIIVCSRSPKLLKNVLKSIRSTTTYSTYEIIVAEDCIKAENPEMVRLAAEYGCRRISVEGPFNFSRINNTASAHAKGEILVFLNDDVEPLRADWLSSMVSHLERKDVGIVGAKLLYPSGAIQHAGVVVGIGHGAGHVNRYKYAGVYWKWIDHTRNVSAVTGACLAVRTELFRRVGGFDTTFPNNYNDVDFCLRVRDAGYRILYEPSAVLRHYEGQTRAFYVDYDERMRFYTRWYRIIESGDPFYNPNLAPDDEEGSLNFRAVQQNFAAR